MNSRKIVLSLSAFIIGGFLGTSLGVKIGYEQYKHAYKWEIGVDEEGNVYDGFKVEYMRKAEIKELLSKKTSRTK